MKRDLSGKAFEVLNSSESMIPFTGSAVRVEGADAGMKEDFIAQLIVS
jgi:hypothetical protein